MSGLEIAIPIISAIFALVSAFKDGGTIVEKIKDRRRTKGAHLPNEKLQRALLQGADQIQQARAEGIDEFGDAYDRDAVTASKLKDVTIVLQDSIIRQLAAACNDDTIDNFDAVTTSAILARKEAVNILNELYMSLQTQRTVAGQMMHVDPRIPPPRVHTINSQHPITPVSGSIGSSPPHEYGVPMVKTRTGSWLDKLRRPSVDTGQGTQRSTRLSPQSGPGDQDVVQQQQPRQGLSPVFAPTGPPSDGPRSPRANRMSTTLSILSPPLSPLEWTHVTRNNNFVGLCKGAWYAQRLKLTKAMESSMRDYEWLYHCRECKYRLHADGSRRGNPQFDDRMQLSGSVYFRLLFLWKSHIDTKDEFRRYKCLLCIFGRGQSSIYKGEDHLFEHIARHEGGLYGDTPITGPLEVSTDGVMPSSIASFDLYLPAHRTQSTPHFMLPESAWKLDASEPQASAWVQGDPFENAWEHEGLEASRSEA